MSDATYQQEGYNLAVGLRGSILGKKCLVYWEFCSRSSAGQGKSDQCPFDSSFYDSRHRAHLLEVFEDF